MDVRNLRREYRDEPFTKGTVTSDPWEQFSIWFDQALAAGVPEPNAMVLATASAEGRPSSRTLLLKAFGRDGALFFTSLHSRKAAELQENPHASMTFLWHELERQVVIDGAVEPVPRDTAETYFSDRPRDSQLATWASQQGETLPSRSALRSAFREQDERFSDRDVPCPPHWGGFRLLPERFEFWKGQPQRLHDRIQYRREGDDWTIERLSP